MERNGNVYRLSSGREFQANQGLLSVNGDGVLYDGYDGQCYFLGETGEEDAPLTAAERQEIAEYMIAAWKRWAALEAK